MAFGHRDKQGECPREPGDLRPGQCVVLGPAHWSPGFISTCVYGGMKFTQQTPSVCQALFQEETQQTRMPALLELTPWFISSQSGGPWNPKRGPTMLSGDPQGQSHFHNSTQMFASFVLAFAQMAQKQ